MLQAIIVIALYISRFFRLIFGGIGTKSALPAFFLVMVGSFIFKLLDFFALGFVVYTAGDALLTEAIEYVQVYLSALSYGEYGYLLVDLLTTLKFPQAISLVLSALSIAITISATKTAMKFSPKTSVTG
ncbi:MAG: DUF2523 domain-containing protein [Bacteroidales bacterium]|nr:DUF2523 domain-containing protein [Bacteroidales bacterium]